jgi:anti-sigma-K factor RskA
MTDRLPPAEDPDLPDRDEDAALCAEYALGLLTPEELRAFEARMAVDPAFRAQAILWTEDLATLADAVPPVTPPPAVEAALRARLFPEEKQGWLRRLGLLPAMVGGLVAALMVLWASNSGVLLPDPAVGPAFAARVAAEDGSLVVEVSLVPATGTLTLTRVTGAAPEGRVLELWLIAPEAAPVSLGLLPAGETGELALAADVLADIPGATLALSDEPPGGSPTGQPTGSVLALGPVTAL